MNSVEVKVNSDAESAEDIWAALNEGENWSDFESKDEDWWDDEDEIDWNKDVLSGGEVETEAAEASEKVRKINVVDGNELVE